MNDKIENKLKSEPVDSPLISEATSADKAELDARENKAANKKKEIGGPKGLEPTRYGDWESKGRCYDF